MSPFRFINGNERIMIDTVKNCNYILVFYYYISFCHYPTINTIDNNKLNIMNCNLYYNLKFKFSLIKYHNIGR